MTQIKKKKFEKILKTRTKSTKIKSEIVKQTYEEVLTGAWRSRHVWTHRQVWKQKKTVTKKKHQNPSAKPSKTQPKY